MSNAMQSKYGGPVELPLFSKQSPTMNVPVAGVGMGYTQPEQIAPYVGGTGSKFY